MKKLLLAAMMFVTLGSLSAADSSENMFSVSLTQGISSKYVWRGVAFSEDTVNQGDATVSADLDEFGTFSVGVWYNLDLEKSGTVEAGHVSEVDYTFGWENDFDGYTLGAGYIVYDFPGTDGETREAYLSVSLDTYLAPSITAYYDVEDVDGLYLELAIGHDFDTDSIVKGSSVSVGATLGWASDEMDQAYYGASEGEAVDGLSNASLSVSWGIPVCEMISVTPFITYTTLLDNATTNGTEDANIIGGLNLSIEF